MSRVRLTVIAQAVLLSYTAVGCQEQQSPKTTYSNQWPGWVGDATIDPADDVAKLQGRWDIVLLGTKPDFLPGSHIVIENDTITYYHPEPGKPERKAGYQFVLNSSIEPKVMRHIHWLGPGEPLPGTKLPSSGWYKLEGNTVTFWDQYAERGERVRVSYRRAKEDK